MRKRLATSLAILCGALLVGAALSFAASETTGTNVSCATATLPAHTIGVDGTDVHTIAGTSTTSCNTQTYTIPTVTTTVTGSGTTTSSTTSSAPGIGACSVGPPGASWTVGGQDYSQAGVDTFTKDQASGAAWSNGNDTVPVYTGDHGMKWVTYPDGWGANGVTPAYQPSTVLSVHDGVLDFNLHNELGSSPSPIPASGQYQTYGAYSMCEKVAPDAGSNLRDFKQAILLWPQSDANGGAAESDFPEGNFTDAAGAPATSMSAFAHHGAYPTQDAYQSDTLDLSQWHVYTQTWGPGFRSYYVDGKLIGTSTSSVWSQPERWQLQVQPLAGSTTGGHGHVYVNWVWIGSPTGSQTTTSSTTSTTPTTSTTSSTSTTSTTSNPPLAGTIKHVVVIAMENQDYSTIYTGQPFETSFANAGGLATSYYGTGHFSLDNYLTMTSGVTGVGNNDSCVSIGNNNIFNQLGAGNAVNYEESGNACRHEPASQYSDLGSGFQQPLPSTFTASTFNPAYVFISPSLCDDGHDSCSPTNSGVVQGDNWLSQEIPKIEATPQYQSGSMAVFIVYDEASSNDVQGSTTPPDNHVYLAVQAQGLAPVRSATQFTHCSLLRTTEDLLGLPALGCASSAASMVSAFNLG